jgi:hypothetical protein
MNCFSHLQVSSVATCQDCRRGLCSLCSDRYRAIQKNPICHICFHSRRDYLLKFAKREIRNVFLLSPFLIGLILAIFLENTPLLPAFLKQVGILIKEDWSSGLELVVLVIAVSFISISFLAGWKIFKNLGLLPRFLLALYTGPFVAPFWFWKKVKQIKKLQRLENR